MSISVLSPGLLTTVQDGGRTGHAALGIGQAGAMDATALRLANILVGNVENAAALEFTLRGPRLHFGHDSLIAVTGAEIDAHCGDVPLPMWRPIAIRAGTEIAFGGMRRGARAYLAVAGGIGVASVIGSRSSDLNAGIGGHALVTSDALPAQPAQAGIARRLWSESGADTCAFASAHWALDPQPWFDPDLRRPIRVITGTHFPRLDDASRHALLTSSFRIGADSNRVGYRLEGLLLAMREPLELVSEGVTPGTVQLPPNGNPIVLMAEAPTCGGYPRLGQIIGVDLPRLAQYRPGDRLRFTEASLDDAQTRYLERERALGRIAQTVAERLHE